MQWVVVATRAIALGEVPNLAARLQGLAAPNTLVVSSATYRLIQGYFLCQTLGSQTLRGVAQPVQVYQVVQRQRSSRRFDVAAASGLTPLVGASTKWASCGTAGHRSKPARATLCC